MVHLATARGRDALTGVPAAGPDGAPVLLVEPTCLPAAAERQLDRLQPTTVVVLGGARARQRPREHWRDLQGPQPGGGGDPAAGTVTPG